MIIFSFFISILLGLNIKNNYAFFLILASFYFIFLFNKLNKKHVIFNILVFLVSTGISFIKLSFDKEIYKGIVLEIKENYFIFSSSLEKMYVYEKEHNYEIGDYLLIYGEKEDFDFTKLESSFDFEKYLNKKGIYQQLNCTKIEYIFKTPIRLNYFKKHYINSFDLEASKFVSNILFSSNEEENLSESLKELHLSRFLSMSGLYLYSFYSLICYILSIFLNKKHSKGIGIVILSFYVFISFYKFITLKFLFFLIFRYINEFYLNKKYSSIEMISLIGISFLILDYNLAYQDSFIIGMFLPIISYFFNTSIKIKNSFLRQIILNLILYISFIPFEINYYHEINLLSLIYQIIFSPVFIVLINLSLLALYGFPFQLFVNFLYKPINVILNYLIDFKIVIYFPTLNIIFVILFYLLIILLAYFIYIKHKPFIKIAILSLVTSILIISIPFKNLISEEVIFINVGQGDATLIRKKETTILIDTGGLKYLDIAKESLIPFFKKKQIYNIDALITTHDDFDHNGGVTSLIENFKIKSLYINIKFNELIVGDITLYNLNRYESLWSEDNDSSLVLYFNISNKDFLVMGDAPIKIEKEIINNNKKFNVDVLRVGHHGSKTSTSDEFIKFISPDVAIISVGKNYYGHPNNDVIKILKQNNVTIRRTDKEGSITYFLYKI